MHVNHWAIALCALVLSSIFAERGFANEFALGDILLSNYGGNNVQQYSPAGVLKQTFTGTGTEWGGMVIAPNGNLITTYRYIAPGDLRGGVDVFTPDGTQVATFSTPHVSNSGDVSVFPDATLAITDLTGPVQEYTQDGVFVRTLPMGPGSFHYGNTVAGLDGTLWIAEEGGVLINQSEIGTILRTVSVPFVPRDLVVAGDGSLYVASLSNGAVYHYTSTGSLLGSFGTELPQLEGIGISPDSSKLYVTYERATSIYIYSTAGAALGSFPITNPANPLFITVVPEPSTTAIFCIASVGILRRHDGRSAAQGKDRS